MRRMIVTLTIALLAIMVSGVVAPVVPNARASVAANPAVMVSPSTVVTGSTATVSGTGFTPNNYVFVYWQRPDGSTNGTYVFTDAAGSFSLTLGFDPRHGTGIEYVAGYDYATARWSSFFQVTVTSASPPPMRDRLTATPPTVGVNGATTISGTGFSPNNYVYVQWQRPDGTVNAVFVYTGPTGSFSFQLGFLPAHRCGTETVQAYDYGTATFAAPITIAVTGC